MLWLTFKVAAQPTLFFLLLRFIFSLSYKTHYPAHFYTVKGIPIPSRVFLEKVVRCFSLWSFQIQCLRPG